MIVTNSPPLLSASLLQPFLTKEVSLSMSLLMELQPEQISGGDLQKGQNTACALMIYLPVWHWLLISEGICLTEVLHIYLCEKCALQPRWELVGILIFHKLWLCLHLPRAGSVCRLGAWLDRAQHSKASMGNSLGFDIQDTRKPLKIHPNKIFCSLPQLCKEMWP